MRQIIRIFALFSILFIVLLIFRIFLQMKQNIDFNPTIWKLMPNNSGLFSGFINLRILMKEDLRNNFLSKGKSEKEVLNILGTPYLKTNNHFRFYRSEGLASDRKNVEYMLVYPLGSVIDDLYLVIAFNKNKKLINSWICQ